MAQETISFALPEGMTEIKAFEDIAESEGYTPEVEVTEKKELVFDSDKLAIEFANNLADNQKHITANRVILEDKTITKKVKYEYSETSIVKNVSKGDFGRNSINIKIQEYFKRVSIKNKLSKLEKSLKENHTALGIAEKQAIIEADSLPKIEIILSPKIPERPITVPVTPTPAPPKNRIKNKR